ncbi:hypothetical protein Acr_08g0000670 [Actinidia rufa]|uniref:RING-type domain-containing protein n=1 Tax=Actinidia rufa TaxID=165716 RepID=A0A7J0EZ08_9ERIC|nr:hypothetical protein Acr_08g0000670 [Actinidia rufa]
MGGGGGASSKLRRAARKIVQTCCSFSREQSPVTVSDHHTTTTSTVSPTNILGQPRISATPGEAASGTQPLSSTCTTKAKGGPWRCSEVAPSRTGHHSFETQKQPLHMRRSVYPYSFVILWQNLCAICLDPLSYGTGTSPAQAVFTAQCSHAFHFACISCNVRHGSVTCPICRAQWTQLPRNLNPSCSLSCNKTDPILQILDDDSIATFRVHRRSVLRSARYNDDDPIEPDSTPTHPRLHFNIIPVTLSLPSCHPCSHQSLQVTRPISCHSYGFLSLNHLRTSSLLLAAPPGGQHFAPTGKTPYVCTSSSRAYLSVTLAHQPATDLVLVASPNGPHLRLIKQCMALVVFSLRPIDRLAIVTYSSAAARVFPLKRMTSYGKRTALQVIDRIFYMGQADPIEGLKKGSSRVEGVIKEIQLRIGENARILRLGELRGGEERRIPLILGESGRVCVEYSYIEGGIDECTRTGEILVGVGDERERVDGTEALVSIGGRNSNVESWDYCDPYRARRWAKHLHGYRM